MDIMHLEILSFIDIDKNGIRKSYRSAYNI